MQFWIVRNGWLFIIQTNTKIITPTNKLALFNDLRKTHCLLLRFGVTLETATLIAFFGKIFYKLPQ